MKIYFNQRSLDLAEPKIMGILNLTPNSFSDGGDYYDPEKALDRAYQMIEEGADIIDIGAESTNPKANPISSEEEQRRLLPVVQKLVDKIKVPISVDTFRSNTIRTMIDEGIDIINDVTAMGETDTIHHIANSEVAICIMHMLGTPENMHVTEVYSKKGITADVSSFLSDKMNQLFEAEVEPARIILDPGFGFDKTTPQNLLLLKELQRLTDIHYPILIGVSRKRMIAETTHTPEPKDRFAGSISAALWAIENGARIVRVHDIKATKDALVMWQAIKSA